MELIYLLTIAKSPRIYESKYEKLESLNNSMPLNNQLTSL